MTPLNQIENFYPETLKTNPSFRKYLLKEYIQLLILDYLTTTFYLRKITFIGGTCLRLVKGIDRFSEDLDFDCKDLSGDEFMEMTNDILQFLKRNGYSVEPHDKINTKLSAFRRNIYFPELLFELKLSGYKEERFLVKVEAYDQRVHYPAKMSMIKGCGLFFQFPVAPDAVLCAMKISAALSRSKGRDFYDSMFLLEQTQPDYDFLLQKCNIKNLVELKEAVAEKLKTIDLKQKKKDFEHLLFQKRNSSRILLFGDYIQSLKP